MNHGHRQQCGAGQRKGGAAAWRRETKGRNGYICNSVNNKNKEKINEKMYVLRL